MSKVAVLGAGSWGIATSILLISNGHEVTLWEFDQKEAEKLGSLREHPGKLPGVKLPEEVLITNDLKGALEGKDLIALPLPSHTMREVAQRVSPLLQGDPVLLSLSKGIEIGSLKRISEVLTDELPKAHHSRIAVLSGPSHAEEVARRMPTTITVASKDGEVSRRVQEIFMNDYFRVYTHRDLVGVELAGSLKNVIAIAVGICDGLGFGDNTKGALLARGLAEIARLGVKLGADYRTFAGLSGVGDLITTAMSKYSRNRHLGEEIGRGKSLDQVLSEMTMVAEGVKTTQSAYALAQKHEVEMPITEQVYLVLFEKKSSKAAAVELMVREPKAEIWF
jgi:glycerol-3-phosphate dehydrogenase (NAD(P)+)